MGLREVGAEVVEWINLAQEWEKLIAVLSTYLEL